jgi:hypothetical protein
MIDVPEQRIVVLLGLLRPAPAAWVETACAIPRRERDPASPLASERGIPAPRSSRGRERDG